MKQIDDLALEELQGQTTFIQAEPAAPTPPAGCRGEDERRRHAGLPALKEHTAVARWFQFGPKQGRAATSRATVRCAQRPRPVGPDRAQDGPAAAAARHGSSFSDGAAGGRPRPPPSPSAAAPRLQLHRPPRAHVRRLASPHRCSATACLLSPPPSVRRAPPPPPAPAAAAARGIGLGEGLARVRWNLRSRPSGGDPGGRRELLLAYRGADVFLLAFSLISKASYENVSKKWIPELRHYAPGVPIILVGTKLDLRDDKQFFVDHPGAVPISTAQGEELKKVIGATAYIECGSKTQQNIKAVFDAAIKVVLQPPKQKRKKRKAQKGCTIL